MTKQLALTPFPPLKPVTMTPQLNFNQLQMCNSSQMTVRGIYSSFHPPISFQPIVAPFFGNPISLKTAPRLLIQSIAANTAAILLLPNRQQILGHGSVPDFAMAQNRIPTHGKVSFGTTIEKNWLFRLPFCLHSTSRFSKKLSLQFLI